MDTSKLNFLRTEFPSLLRKLGGNETPQWGVMNPQQMVEHLSDSFRQANGKDKIPVQTPAEHLPAYKNFMMSDKEFRQNTRNVLLSDTPPPLRKAGMPEAIAELEQEISDFINVFEKQPGHTITNPIFGELNFDEWLHLLHKHARHHLKQFGLIA